MSDGSVVQGIDAKLPVGGEITGQVTSASTGDPLPNVSVSASGASGAGYGTASTDANGDYTIVGLPTDNYYVSYQDPAGSYLDQQYTQNPVAVAAGQTTTAIDAAMQSAAKISGTVTDSASGQPIDGIQATAYDANGNYITSTDTDGNGAYTLSDLPTGSYRVEFSNDYDLGGYLTQYYNARSSLATADPITATAGQTTTGINAAMQAGGRHGNRHRREHRARYRGHPGHRIRRQRRHRDVGRHQRQRQLHDRRTAHRELHGRIHRRRQRWRVSDASTTTGG